MFARAASCDVTPRDRPVRLAGYALRTAPVTAVLDPIEISAVLLDCAEARCLIFSFDLMIVGSELQDIILARLQRFGFQSREVVLLASHAHSAPATDQASARLGIPDIEFVNDVAEAAEALVSRMLQEPPFRVSADVFQGRLNHSTNRRRHWPFPTVGRMHGFKWRSVTFSPNPSGPKDETATVALLRRNDNGQALAAIWHYTCHPTAVVPDSVISSDYPGAVRHVLRERFGQIPCLFVQGFCGNIRPDIRPSPQKISLRERLHKIIRVVVFGNLFPILAPGDWMVWSTSLAAAIDDVVKGKPVRTLSPARLRTGSASIALDRFFTGTTPDKRLAVQIVRIGEELEIVALSAEATVEWKQILDETVPPSPEQLRLYAGYLGALYGYLPTAAQVLEGGYEVEGFQPFFGLSGHFEADRIKAAVAGCVERAFEDMERAKGVAEPTPSLSQ